MLTFIPQNSSRDQYLFGQAIQYVKKSAVGYYDDNDIYEVSLNKRADIIVLGEQNLSNNMVSYFLSEITSNQLPIKTKIILLTDDQKYKHANIVNVPKRSYLPFNEFYEPQTTLSYEYVLCHLNNNKQDENQIINNVLYPVNKEIPVKIINCSFLIHPQNLGIVAENDMLDLLHSCSIYVCVGDDYLYDAIRMNKKIICMKKNDYIDNHSELSVDSLKTVKVANERCNIDTINKYSISNIIKHVVKL